MHNRRSGKCILSCNGKSCVNDSTETFKEVICPYHLSQVFGLKVQIEMFETVASDFYIGPFLIVDNSFNFEANTVVFPERDFIDQYLNMADETNEEFYNYKLNPRMATYLANIQSNAFNFSPSELRYQTEIIRNLSFPSTVAVAGTPQTTNPNKIKLAQETEISNKSLHVEIETRFKELNATIENEDYHKIFSKMTILDVSGNGSISMDEFTPFMCFMLFNCVTDEHMLPNMIVQNQVVGITTYLNLLYKKGVGFVTSQEMMHPNYLVVAGKTTGNNNFYQMKVRSICKQTIQNNHQNMRKKNLADNVRSSNILNPQLDYCWTR